MAHWEWIGVGLTTSSLGAASADGTTSFVIGRSASERASRVREGRDREPPPDLLILTRHLTGDAARNLFVAVRTIEKMTAALGTLRAQLEAEPVERSMVPDSPGLRMLREHLGLDDGEAGQ